MQIKCAGVEGIARESIHVRPYEEFSEVLLEVASAMAMVAKAAYGLMKILTIVQCTHLRRKLVR